MRGSAHPGRKRPKKHEEDERWLVSYADMVTLLMCLFIVLFAMSQIDKAKFAALADGLAQSFGAPITALASRARSQPSVIDERVLVVHIVSDPVLFGPVQATLQPAGARLLDAVAPTLNGLPNQLR